MPKKPHLAPEDPFIGIRTREGYTLIEKVGAGGIGAVYKAEGSSPDDIYAFKIIPEGGLKDGWERELEKLRRLRRLPNIVQYHGYGSDFDRNNRPFTFIIFDFIKGVDLARFLNNPSWPLDMAFIESIAETILTVLHACQVEDIRHGDLHEGNILIEDPDPRRINSPRTIWIADFGYGGSHNSLQPKDDFKQTFSVLSRLLRRLDPATLNPRDKVMHTKVKEFLDKRLLEIDPTQGGFVGNPQSLLDSLKEFAATAERESAAATRGEALKEPGDYLWAEALGYRADEWKDLFVPEFLAARQLLSKDITVLTGARGCGKTMSFRRLTAYMDQVIGAPSGVPGADQFIGFYLNCRDFAEAFPWLPQDLSEMAERQIIHYFHLAWLSEIGKTLARYDPNQEERFDWLDGFFAGLFLGKYQPLPGNVNALTHVRAFIENEKEQCRLAKLGSGDSNTWLLAKLDLLDLIQKHLERHVPWMGDKPLYFFLDDYTIPIVPREVQRTLNPIIFKRRDKLFFKISTEAANSFDQRGFRDKPLEVFHDFKLIDLATESLHQDEKAKSVLLDKIFRPRIDRHEELKGKQSGLKDVLGKTRLSNNQLAQQMRDNVQSSDPRKKSIYQGSKVFAGMWSSDIRTMIQMFTEILREASVSKDGLTLPISSEIQNKIYKAKGGEFLDFAGSIPDPASWEQGPSSTKAGEPYGTHLIDIVEAFILVSRHEMTRGALVSNEGKYNPKQAFRLEIVDKLVLTNKAKHYYHGLVRWHLFLQDWRGKSVRGMITPRLYLNRVLIPRANLTFSSHDNIHLTTQEFVTLLEKPREFGQYWISKTKKGRKKAKVEPPSLWDN